MLEIKDISIETISGKSVVKHASFSVYEGKTTVLMGPNGSGKSSLLLAMMGHPGYRITEGKILVDGEDITNLPTEEKAKKGIFLSLQLVPEIPGVTMVNFLHRAYQSLTGIAVSIPEFYANLKSLAVSLGIDPQFIKRELHAGFSGGEKKISEVLQMVLLKPRFAFLDEIDSGVDVDALKKILAGVERVKEAKTGVLLITHYPTLLQYLKPDTVLVMAKGTIAATGGQELAEDILKNGFSKFE